MRPFILFLLIFLTVCQALADDQVRPDPVPSLVQSIQFSGKILLFGEEIPHQIPEVKEDLEKEMLLALGNQPQVVLWLKRAPRYFPHMEKIIKEAGLPEDLKYVAVIESALRPYSRSSRGAVGFWQFLAPTGLKYGLRIDDRVDERRSLFRSTQAACQYIKDLKAEFGSFHLALAAYNMGEFGLNAEIEIQETRSFFSLYLPLETQQYIFKVAAAKLIMEAPERYGFHLSAQDLYPDFAYSNIHFSMVDEIPLSLVARAAGIPFKTLKEFNPEILGYDLAPGRVTIRVPEGSEKGFKERFFELHKEWKQRENQAKYHVVRPGENLTGIAGTYQISLSRLLRLNRFPYNKVIHPGDRVRVQ